MLTAFCRNGLTGNLVKYNVECDDMAAVAEAMKEELGDEYKAPILFSIPCGKGSLKEQPEIVERA